VSNIAKELMKLGHEVLVITPEHSEVKEEFPTSSIIFRGSQNKDYHVPFNFPCFTTHPVSTNTFYELKEDERLGYVRVFEEKITKAVEEFKPDIIHANHVWVASYVACKTKIPCVITAHGTCQMGFKKKGGEPYRAMALKSAQDAGRIIAISKPIMQDVVDFYNIDEKKVVLIGNGMDDEKFTAKRYDKDRVLYKYNIPYYINIVAFAGKFTHFKGIDVLIDAAEKYEQVLESVATIIMGGGELEEEIKKKVKEHNLKHVYFTGPLPQEEVAKIFSIASVSVVPSRREPFGLVAIEALACGTPVVATNEGGLPEFVNEKVGSLVDVDNCRQLAAHIITAVTDNWKKKKGQYAAEYAKESYTWSGIVKRIESVYKEVLNT
jgi:glycosyltransferase involved in cell wall biosynthesis